MKLSQQVPTFPEYIQVESFNNHKMVRVTRLDGQLHIGTIKEKMSTMGKIKTHTDLLFISDEDLDRYFMPWRPDEKFYQGSTYSGSPDYTDNGPALVKNTFPEIK